MFSQRRVRSALAILLASASMVACAGPSASPQAANGQPQPAAPQKALVLITRQETPSVSGTALVPGNFTIGSQRRPFNAWLSSGDANDKPSPYLAESLPQLNTESWKVTPDGKMETIYRLRPNITWHDGTAFSAEDFVFAWKVYTTPDFGLSASRPHVAMEEVQAPDARTVVVIWKQLYPDAGILGTNFAPLPRHILETALPQGRDFFLNQPYWTTKFVGAGPYKLDRWEPGAFIEGSAFDGHILGRPKIEKIRISFIGDADIVLANLLSGDCHIPVDNSIRVQQALVLNEKWGPTGGTIIYLPTLWRWSYVQHRPEYANPKAILDLGVRKALMHAMNKTELNNAILDGKGIMSDSFVPPGVNYFPDVDKTVAKYPFDLRRTEQLMNEAGYAKGADGIYAGPEGKPSFEYRVISSAQNDAERSVLADGWRKAGFAIDEANFSPAETSQGETSSTFRTLWTSSGGQGEAFMVNPVTSLIPGPENNWRGSNRGAWSNADYDRIVNTFSNTLDRSQRDQLIVQAAKVITENLGVMPLFFNPAAWAWPSSVQGVNIIAPTTEPTWNIHEWTFK